MKKMIVLLAAMTLTATAASAQPLRLGVKGGLTSLSTDINGRVGDNNNQFAELTSKSVGWQLGFMGRVSIPLTNIYIQPELMFNHAGYTYRPEDERKSNISYNNIELPVLLGFKILFLNAHIGPVFTLGTFENHDIYKIKRPDFGFQAGLGFTYHQLTFDIRHHGYFSKNWKNVNFSDINDKVKANEGYWSFSFGYFF